jgi:Domain of unknown function (DUF4331)
MQLNSILAALGRLTLASTVAAMSLAAAGCSDDNSTGPGTSRMYNQIQRLGNPLVSEVLLAKRSHPTHGSLGPQDDAAVVGPEILSFITGPGSVAGRSADYATTLGSVLLPDMLVVQTDRDPSTAGWLNWVGLPPLADGWGGRKLEDDVVDLALLAVFGDPFGADPQGAQGKEGLTTDNVAFDSPVTATFPYLGMPN